MNIDAYYSFQNKLRKRRNGQNEQKCSAYFVYYAASNKNCAKIIFNLPNIIMLTINERGFKI